MSVARTQPFVTYVNDCSHVLPDHGRSMSGDFQAEASWARERAALATGVHRDLMVAVAEAYDLLAKLEIMLREPAPLQQTSAPHIAPTGASSAQAATDQPVGA